MADTNLPAGPVPAGAAPVPVGAGNWRARMADFTAQPAFRRALPAMVGTGAIAVIAAAYLMIASGPQRVLYADLSDGDRASVVEALERGGIGYTIDNATGALSVSEDDVYRARMLVASDAGIAAPQGASEMLDAIPLGSSRTLEGERMRLARERELMLTIREIDGIEAVRVHLATPERSVFVRENNPPSASVMVRLVSGRSLGQSQVEAIVNLVSASVPGMSADAVRVVDQNGRLLSSEREDGLQGLVLQRELESKLREQVSQLLAPLLGDGNFTAQVQAVLDQSEVTSARESYDQEGVVRSESERTSTRLAGPGMGGVPGVAANTPPPDAELVDGPPLAEGEEEAAGEAAVPPPSDEESAVQRNYELGREVAVTNTRPGSVVRLTVAVAVSNEALEAAAPMTAEQLQALVTAAVGADVARGDQVEVVVSAFETTEIALPPFYEQAWFADVLRYGTALIVALLVLFLVVRPLIARMREPAGASGERDPQGAVADKEEGDQPSLAGPGDDPAIDLPQRVALARKLTVSQPDRAVEALQRMLEAPPEPGEGAAAR